MSLLIDIDNKLSDNNTIISENEQSNNKTPILLLEDNDTDNTNTDTDQTENKQNKNDKQNDNNESCSYEPNIQLLIDKLNNDNNIKKMISGDYEEKKLNELLNSKIKDYLKDINSENLVTNLKNCKIDNLRAIFDKYKNSIDRNNLNNLIKNEDDEFLFKIWLLSDRTFDYGRLVESVKTILLPEKYAEFREKLAVRLAKNKSIILKYFRFFKLIESKDESAGVISNFITALSKIDDLLKFLIDTSKNHNNFIVIMKAAYSPITLKQIVKKSGARYALTTFFEGIGLSMLSLVIYAFGHFFKQLSNKNNVKLPEDITVPKNVKPRVLSFLGKVLGWTLYRIPPLGALGCLSLLVIALVFLKIGSAIEPKVMIDDKGNIVKPNKDNNTKYEKVPLLSVSLFCEKTKNIKSCITQNNLIMNEISNIIKTLFKAIPQSLGVLAKKVIRPTKLMGTKMAFIEGLTKSLSNTNESLDYSNSIEKHNILENKDNAKMGMYSMLLEFSLTGSIGNIMKKIFGMLGLSTALAIGIKFIVDSVGGVDKIQNETLKKWYNSFKNTFDKLFNKTNKQEDKDKEDKVKVKEKVKTDEDKDQNDQNNNGE